jgi:hypothetical protein
MNRVKVALINETDRPWHEVEQQFLESEYRAVRDRQMKELELEDDLLNKVPVRFVHLLSQEYSLISLIEIYALNFIRSRTNLFDNSASNA